MLWFAGIKDLLYAHLLLISDCELQTSLQIIIWGASCKPASSSLLLPILSTCLVFPHMPGTDLAGSIITCVGFVCHGYYTKNCWSDFYWMREDGRGNKARMNQWYSWNCMWIKRWWVKIFWASLYILKLSLFFLQLSNLPPRKLWMVLICIHPSFIPIIFQVIPCSALCVIC